MPANNLSLVFVKVGPAVLTSSVATRARGVRCSPGAKSPRRSPDQMRLAGPASATGGAQYVELMAENNHLRFEPPARHNTIA
jgi:hypothetical protein